MTTDILLLFLFPVLSFLSKLSFEVGLKCLFLLLGMLNTCLPKLLRPSSLVLAGSILSAPFKMLSDYLLNIQIWFFSLPITDQNILKSTHISRFLIHGIFKNCFFHFLLEVILDYLIFRHLSNYLNFVILIQVKILTIILCSMTFDYLFLLELLNQRQEIGHKITILFVETLNLA